MRVRVFVCVWGGGVFGRKGDKQLHAAVGLPLIIVKRCPVPPKQRALLAGDSQRGVSLTADRPFCYLCWPFPCQQLDQGNTGGRHNYLHRSKCIEDNKKTNSFGACSKRSLWYSNNAHNKRFLVCLDFLCNTTLALFW